MRLSIDTLTELATGFAMISEVIPSQDHKNVKKDLQLILKDPKKLAKFSTGLYRLRANMMVFKQSEVKVLPTHVKEPFVDQIIQVTSQVYGLKPSDIKSKSRQNKLAEARHVVMWILRQMTDMSLSDIGMYVNRTCHTTVISGINKVERDVVRKARAVRIMERVQV